MKNVILILMTLFAISCNSIDEQINETSNFRTTEFNPFQNVDTIVILGMGQSNMVSDCPNTGGIIAPNDSVKAYNSKNKRWYTATNGTSPLLENNGHIVNSLAHKISEYYDKPVKFLVFARGAQPIEKWLPPLNMHMVSTVRIVNESGLANQKVHIIAWHQGEANGNSYTNVCNNNTCYIEKLNELKSILRSYSWFGEEGIFIAGGLRGNPATNRTQAIYTLNNSYSDNDAAAKSSGLDGCNAPHFTGESLKILGEQRYFEALQNLLNN